MKAQSINSSYAGVIDAGLLSCHAVKPHGSFRARDLRRFIDLFTNWIDPGLRASQTSNTHLSRLLKQYSELGLIKSSRRTGQQRFIITVLGQTRICKSFVGRDYSDQPEQCLFVLMFLTKYLHPYLKQQAQIRGLATRQLVQQLSALASPMIFIETQLHFLRQKQAAIQRQLAIFRKLKQLLPEIDLTSTNVADILEYLEGDTIYFMHQHQTADRFFRMTDHVRLVNEIKQGTSWRATYLLEPALARYDQFEKLLTAAIVKEGHE